ncbi:hypothetical protein CW709_04855 [Candidatus Bathyarchaeota archaeon]|nr:MAG: hypothetical protein CP083_05950 [Candidatus Bathyarchaeota archaeon B24-2]RJS81545.1 MAG: hypothetical protein CW709_04855 [Candidatus Bathyarchaeota archaeon]HDM44995.1 hypothetical protein [Candidatus Bathyarchaeota archaeon]
MEKKKLLIVEYPDNSSVVYEVPKEVEAVEEVTSEVVEYWNLKLRNKDGTYSWIRINSPSRGDEVLIRTFDRTLEYKTTRDKVKKDEVTRGWVK